MGNAALLIINREHKEGGEREEKWEDYQNEKEYKKFFFLILKSI